MRKTSLYIALSVLAMIAAFWLGELDRQGKLHCPAATCTRADVSAYQRLYENAIEGRFHRAARVASRMTQADPTNTEARLYLAYALRGLNQPEAAAAQYTRILGHSAEPWMLIDAWTGRAAAYLDKGKASAADEDLTAALALAQQEEARHNNSRTAYQLACIYAQRTALYESLGSTSTAERESTQAQEWLQSATTRGYNNQRHIRNDLDLQPLRKIVQEQYTAESSH